VLRSKLPAQTNARLALTTNPLDLQRHGLSALKNSRTNAITKPFAISLQEWKLELCAVLNVQEFLSDEENMIGIIGPRRGSVS